MSPDTRPLTRAACRDVLDQQTFRLRPKDYPQKYPLWPGSVGLEIEMLPYKPASTKGAAPGRVVLQGDGVTSAAIIKALAAEHPGWQLEYTDGDHGQPLLLKVELEGHGNFSFEPGGQVEYSSKPYPCLSEAVTHMRAMQKLLDKAFGAHGLRFAQVGINPWQTLDELGLQMPKGRYRAMDRHFAKISPYGQRMMRQTCTVQVNLDFGPDEATLTKRYLASQLLAPVAAATFANSPVVDRAKTGVVGFRSRIWRHADPTRTGLVGLERLSKEMSRAAAIDTYLDFALNATVVFVAGLDYKVPATPVTFGQWLATPIEGVRPNADDFATHLSLMFAEVRPRGFLELRSIDCQPCAFQDVPASYTTGLLYHGPTLDRLLDLLLPRLAETKDLLARAEEGLHNPALAALSAQVIDLAQSGFEGLPSCFKAAGGERELNAFATHFTQRGRTPADDVLDQMSQKGDPWISDSDLVALQERWEKLVSP